VYRILNANRSSVEEKLDFYRKLEAFLTGYYLELERAQSPNSEQTRDDDAPSDEEDDKKRGGMDIHSSSALSERNNGPTEGAIEKTPSPFNDIKTKYDVAVLELCSDKLKQFIIDLMEQEKEKNSDGIVIQVGIRQSSGSSMHYSSRNGLLSTCLVLRLARNSSVYSLREELAQRLSRSLIQDKQSEYLVPKTTPGEFAGEASEANTHIDCSEMKVLQRTRLCYDNRDRGSTGYSSVLGMIGEDEQSKLSESGDKVVIAVQSNEKEQVFVADRVKNRGKLYLYLEHDDDCEAFDAEEFDSVAEPGGVDASTKESVPGVSILDCIKNYCKKEQLEESEMWYCNKCKKHVRAWKQFHLYRTPPILIIHLKRFFFSASNHRRDKITRKIDFPLEGLDLRDLVADYGEHEKPIYDCYAVSNHFGGLGGGHYTAFTLSDDGIWCNYDDSRVTTDVNQEEVVSEAAYVLYYRRRDIPVGEDLDVIVDAQISPMICERADAQGEASEMSSNNTAQAGDMDLSLDDTDSNGSSKTALSPMESVDNNDHTVPNRIEDFDRPLQ
jgi:hypothetical protein